MKDAEKERHIEVFRALPVDSFGYGSWCKSCLKSKIYKSGVHAIVDQGEYMQLALFCLHRKSDH